MKLKCPNCESVYSVSDSRVPNPGGYARCAVCRSRFPIQEQPDDLRELHPPEVPARSDNGPRSGVRILSLRDNFGRRSGMDRRHLSSVSEGEKRNGADRRKVVDRRNGSDRRNGDRRSAASASAGFRWPSSKDFYPIFDDKGRPIGLTGPGRRNGDDRRRGVDRRDFLIVDFQS